jgi:hypothetical protein
MHIVQVGDNGTLVYADYEVLIQWASDLLHDWEIIRYVPCIYVFISSIFIILITIKHKDQYPYGGQGIFEREE